MRTWSVTYSAYLRQWSINPSSNNTDWCVNILAFWLASVLLSTKHAFIKMPKAVILRCTIQCLSQQIDKNKTNHPISSNSHPSATANTTIHCIKRGRGIHVQIVHFYITYTCTCIFSIILLAFHLLFYSEMLIQFGSATAIVLYSWKRRGSKVYIQVTESIAYDIVARSSANTCK